MPFFPFLYERSPVRRVFVYPMGSSLLFVFFPVDGSGSLGPRPTAETTARPVDWIYLRGSDVSRVIEFDIEPRFFFLLALFHLFEQVSLQTEQIYFSRWSKANRLFLPPPLCSTTFLHLGIVCCFEEQRKLRWLPALLRASNAATSCLLLLLLRIVVTSGSLVRRDNGLFR